MCSFHVRCLSIVITKKLVEFSFNHLSIFARSLFMLSLIVFLFSLVNALSVLLINVVSLAKIIDFKGSQTFKMSFVYDMNSKGPRIDPWGTHIDIYFVPSFFTNCSHR